MGCNRFTGSYQLNGTRLSFGVVARTMRLCVSGMELAKGSLDALGRVAGWRIVGDRLELVDAGDAVLVQFAPASAE